MKNFIKKIGAVFLSLTVAASLLAGCGAKTTEPADASASKGTFRTLEEIKSSGTINIGVFSDKSPFGYVDENGEYQGYDVYFGNRIGEDLGVKINYVSGGDRIETMALARRAVRAGQRALIIDDFMKGGGTLQGMVDMMREFQADVVGVGVMIATRAPEKKLVEGARSLLVLERFDKERGAAVVRPAEPYAHA